MDMRLSPHGWFAYDPAANKWEPTEHNRFPEWKNRVITETFKPDERGKSRWVSVAELQTLYPDSAGQFGGNGSNFFTRNSPVKDFALADEREGTRIVRRRMVGLTNEVTNETSRSIRPEILRAIRSQPCALTGSRSDVECDHRCSRRPPNTDPSMQHLEDFQPLSKTANCRKRQVCNVCMQTGKRYDATELGFPVGWTVGDASTKSCEGCFWFGPREFRQAFMLPPEAP